MYLVYLGESGNTGNSNNDPNQPHHVCAGLVVHESQHISMSGEFDALWRRHFGRPLGEPGDGPSHLRPAEIYQGRGMFNSWAPARRNELIQDCLNIMIRRETPVILAYLNKAELVQARAAGDPQTAEWQSPSEPIIKRFLLATNMFVDEMNMSLLNETQLMESQWPIADFALVVATEGQSVEARFMSEYLRSEDGQDSTAVLNNISFVTPDRSACTQLANMCAYFSRRWLQNPSHSQPYFDALQGNKVIQVIYPVRF